MAVANRETAEALAKSFRAIAMSSLAEAPSDPTVGLVAMQVDSDSAIEEYYFGQDFQTMQKWVGEREMADMRWDSFTIKNDLYEGGFNVRRTDIEDDKLGMFEIRTQNRARAYPRARRKSVVDTLLSNPTGYDGVSLISDSHPNEAGAAQDNYGGASFALTGDNYDAAVLQMSELVDHQGEPLEIEPDTLLVGPKMRATARDLFGVRTTSQGGENVYFNDVGRVVVDKKITDSRWYLLDSSQTLKPIILQNRTGLEYQNITDPSAEYVVKNDAFYYGMRARWGVGAGFWQTIFGANF